MNFVFWGSVHFRFIYIFMCQLWFVLDILFQFKGRKNFNVRFSMLFFCCHKCRNPRRQWILTLPKLKRGLGSKVTHTKTHLSPEKADNMQSCGHLEWQLLCPKGGGGLLNSAAPPYVSQQDRCCCISVFLMRHHLTQMSISEILTE